MMKKTRSLIIQKYGGSSLATTDHIRRVARHITERKAAGCDLVVVVSAMGSTTDGLVKLAHELNPNPEPREMDMLLSCGEQISIAAVALAINSIGRYQAISLTGAQVGIFTDSHHGSARILEIYGERIRSALAENKIVIVAGFQGVSLDNEITTLGRGGSDTTAVALAAALKADDCEIMSDIDGIYTADPKKVHSARRIDKIHYDLALEMAAAGAKMLHKTSIEFAKRHKINLSLGSSLSGHIGTTVSGESLGKGCITAITVDEDVAIIRFALNQTDALQLPALFSQNRIHLKLWQSVHGLGMAGVARGDSNYATRFIRNKTTDISIEHDWALLSLIGDGIGVGSTIAQQFFDVMRDLNIDYKAVMTGDLFLKVLCPLSRVKVALEGVHRKFIDLDTLT
ncbi:aspartate kinase [candidate division KSB1 bacterium]|nr:aspartate kinase [candidate division KSB1 bacterium]RQW02706.1 MAG: aspartate kinase [candidate division KSB1 bacterium]